VSDGKGEEFQFYIRAVLLFWWQSDTWTEAFRLLDKEKAIWMYVLTLCMCASSE
jgi:hypothetical protein